MLAMLLASGAHGIAQLIVTLTPESTQPANVELVQSSGDIIVDAAAIEVARQTQFAPKHAHALRLAAATSTNSTSEAPFNII